MVELLNVALQGGLPLGIITGVALQDPILGNEAALDLPQPDPSAPLRPCLMAVLGLFAGLPPADDVRVRLEDTDDPFTLFRTCFSLAGSCSSWKTRRTARLTTCRARGRKVANVSANACPVAGTCSLSTAKTCSAWRTVARVMPISLR